MGIKGIDIEKVLTKVAQDNNSSAGKKGKKTNKGGSGMLAMASDPMIQEIIKSINPKIKLAIVSALCLVLVGAGTTVYGIVQLVKYIIN